MVLGSPKLNHAFQSILRTTCMCLFCCCCCCLFCLSTPVVCLVGVESLVFFLFLIGCPKKSGNNFIFEILVNIIFDYIGNFIFDFIVNLIVNFIVSLSLILFPSCGIFSSKSVEHFIPKVWNIGF